MSVSAIINIAIYVPFVHFTYILHLDSLYFVFLLTAVPYSGWPPTSNRRGQVFQLRLAGELCHLRRWASSTLGTKTPTHVTSHTQPLGRRQGDPVGRVQECWRTEIPWNDTGDVWDSMDNSIGCEKSIDATEHISSCRWFLCWLYSFLVCAKKDICDAYRA